MSTLLTLVALLQGLNDRCQRGANVTGVAVCGGGPRLVGPWDEKGQGTKKSQL